MWLSCGAVLLLGLWAHTAAAFSPTCELLTGLKGCIECRREGSKFDCLYCGRNWGMVWADTVNPKVAKCIAPSSNCVAANARVPSCALCVGATCIMCKQPPGKPPSMLLSWKDGPTFGKCIPATPAQISGNSMCQTFNRDGTCAVCKTVNGVKRYVMPSNAQFTNAVFPTSSDMTIFLPAECAEVGTDFKCQRCIDGWSLVLIGMTTKCVKDTRGSPRAANGCRLGTPWQAYCLQCNTAGTACAFNKCAPGRSMAPQGQCSLPCKQLFGITCAACTPFFCLANDSAFPAGRR